MPLWVMLENAAPHPVALEVFPDCICILSLAPVIAATADAVDIGNTRSLGIGKLCWFAVADPSMSVAIRVNLNKSLAQFLLNSCLHLFLQGHDAQQFNQADAVPAPRTRCGFPSVVAGQSHRTPVRIRRALCWVALSTDAKIHCYLPQK